MNSSDFPEKHLNENSLHFSEEPEENCLVAGRTCDACGVCCKIFGINSPALVKASGILCHHNIDGRCSIYGSRPDVCREWFCLWRLLKEFPDNAHPNKIHVVFSFERNSHPASLFEKAYIIVRAIDDQNSLDAPDVKKLINLFIEEGSLPIWIGLGNRKKLIYPAPKFADAILNPNNTQWEDIVPFAKVWLKKYETMITQQKFCLFQNN